MYLVVRDIKLLHLAILKISWSAKVRFNLHVLENFDIWLNVLLESSFLSFRMDILFVCLKDRGIICLSSQSFLDPNDNFSFCLDILNNIVLGHFCRCAVMTAKFSNLNYCAHLLCFFYVGNNSCTMGIHI